MRMRVLFAASVIVLLLAACGAAAPTQAPTSPPPSPTSAPKEPAPSMGGSAIQEIKPLPELARDADRIVLGTIVSMESVWNVDKTSIFTTIRVRVAQMVKGTDAQEITFVVEGGEVDGLAQASSEAAIFEQGEQVILFLKGEQIVGGPQGVYPVTDSKVGEQPLGAFLDQLRAMK